MSYGNHTVTLQLSETPTDILERELRKAREFARRCEAQGGIGVHTWTDRADALQVVLDRRRSRSDGERL